LYSLKSFFLVHHELCGSKSPSGIILRKRHLNTKANRVWFAFEEASRGFEPLMRILQTLALPLGHDAIYTMRIATEIFHSATLYV
jgi:hypothetical protein